MENNLKRNGRIELSAENAEQGLAHLVLTVIELLRQLIEKHAIRRVDSGNLTDAQIEDLGVALMKLENKMEELKSVFNFTNEDLNIDLGPLGKVL
ncbi:MAG: gas vesicle protein K [Priestia megaterium]|uniref:gas vesicle protein K n=1 Tax=Priestia megaterium TaxID=1404 RepID=UPI003CA497BF